MRHIVGKYKQQEIYILQKFHKLQRNSVDIFQIKRGKGNMKIKYNM